MTQLVKVVMAFPSALTSTGKISAGYLSPCQFDAILRFLTDSHPRDDAKWSVEEREDKVHRYHRSKLVAVVRIEMLAHGCVGDKGSTETCGRDNEWLDPTDLVKHQKSDRAVDD